MIELIVVIVALLLFIGMTKKWLRVQNDKVGVWVVEQEIDLQPKILEVSERIDTLKKANGGWMTISDLENKIK